MHILIKNKYLFYNNYRIKCALGKRGIGEKRKEGDFITPIGLFKIELVLYRKDRIKKLDTVFERKEIKRNMGWCDDPSSKQYNKLVTIPFGFSYEKLFRKDNIYDVILVLNYNTKPIKKNKGSAIFIHIARRKYNYTKGCVAIRKHHLLKLVENLKLNTHIKIVKT